MQGSLFLAKLLVPGGNHPADVEFWQGYGCYPVSVDHQLICPGKEQLPVIPASQ